MHFLKNGLMMICTGFFLVSSAYAQGDRHEEILQAINQQEIEKLQSPYEFRIASFTKEEGSYGTGPLILLITQDMRTAIINMNGVKTELQLMQKTATPSCVTGSSRQQVYAKDQLRLMVKLTLKAGAEACWAQGLVSIRTDKHTNRYMVKGVSGL